MEQSENYRQVGGHVDNPNHSFSPSLAAKYGIIEAILIHHFQHWINHNQSLGRNKKDGRTWTYQTRKEIAAWFEYLSPDQVRRATDRLVECGVLIKGNYNKNAMDKTIWYAFVNEKMFTTGRSASSIEESANSIEEFAKPIPNTKTDTKTDNLSVVGDPVGPPTAKKSPTIEKCSFVSSEGPVWLTDTEIYQKIVAQKVKWSGEEIAYAIEALKNCKSVVHDWWNFLKGTIGKYRDMVKSHNISKSSKGEKQCKTPTEQQKNRPIDELMKEGKARASWEWFQKHPESKKKEQLI